MRHEPRWLLNHVPEDLGWLVGVLFTAAVAAHRNVLRQHGEIGIRIGLSKHDLVRIREIALVMETVVFAEYDPEVVFGHHSPPSHRTWDWALSVVCPDKFLSKVSNM